MLQSKKSSHGKSYLERITFDPKMGKDLIWKYITNMRIVILLVISLLFLGIVSYFSIPRRLNPEIKIPIVTIVTVLPGASPSDVESLVSIPLETSLQNIAGIDTMSSVSQDNVSAISMQFVSTVSQDKAKADVQSVVDSFTDLPKDAQTPVVKALDFEDQPIWTFALSTKGDLPTLMRFADQLKKNIENTAKVDRVLVNGFESQEIAVIVKPEKIKQYNISPLALSSAVKSSIVAYPAGSVHTGTNDFSLTIDPQITSITDIRALQVNISGKSVALGDIAEVVERSREDQRPSFLATAKNTGTRVVTFNVYKSTSADIVESEKAVRKTVDDTLSQYDGRFTVTTIIDTADQINTQFFDLLGEFRSTIILVFACLFVFLGLRQAIIASFTVPLTFLSGFIFMRFLGMSINFLSLFAFLLALGLLVDDTIVTVSAMTTYFRTKKFTAQETGRIVWRDTIVPIWSTTITTIWSFVPLLLSTGIIGEFIKPIPVVVSVTMLSSTAIAVLITLPFMIVLLKPQIPSRVVMLVKIVFLIASFVLMFSIFKTNPLFPLIAITYVVFLYILAKTWKGVTAWYKQKVGSLPMASEIWGLMTKYTEHGVLSIDVLSRKYHWLIAKILDSSRARKIVTIGIIIYALWAFALVPLGFVKNEFFPKSDADTVYVNMVLSPGTNTSTTVTQSKPILEKLRTIPQAQFVTEDIGINQGTFGSSNNGDNLALFTLHLQPKATRTVSSVDIAENLRKQYATYSDGTITIAEQSSGPPAGADLQMKLLGDDLGQLNTYADTISDYLKKQPGVADVQKSITPGTSKLVFVPDQAKLVQYGVTPDFLGLWLRSFASGFTLSDAKFKNNTREKEDIVFSFDDGNQTPEKIGDITIPTSQGSVSLLTLGQLIVKSNPTVITRESGKRSISVSATVRPGFNTTQKNTELEKFVTNMKLGAGYSWKTGGVNDENAKSVASILQAMVIAFILILVTMVIQFQSYRQAVIVLLVIPLAVSSVFVIFALTGTPLSFPALIGVLSLFGIVVTNSMFIVDKINLNIKEGMPFKEAIADAGASRMEPIILTKLCTVFGLLPITLANPLWRGLGGAIISGLLIASSIMLLFIPVVYYEWFKKDYGIKE